MRARIALHLTLKAHEAERLRAREEMQALNAGLDARVAERTAELLAANVALRKSEEKFRSLVETTSDCIWELDVQGCYTYLGPKFQEMTGYPPRDFLGRRPLDLLLPEDVQAFSPPILAALAAQDAFSALEFPIGRRDGLRIFIEVGGVPLFGPEGQYQGLRGIARDITARKRVKDELRTTKERLEATLNALPDLVFRLDREGRILDFHSSATDQLYLAPDLFLGKTVCEVLPPDAARVILDALEEADTHGIHHGGTYSLPMPEGERWFEVSMAVLGGRCIRIRPSSCWPTTLPDAGGRSRPSRP